MSRLHAQFRRRGATVTVEDAGSRNGTWVNGQLVQGERALASGDEVVVGPLTIVVRITSRVVARPRIESTRYLEERLAAEVDRGQAYHRRFSLAMVRLDGPPEAADDAGDRIFAALRPMDAIAEYAPGILAVVMPERDAAAAEQVTRGLLDRARVRGAAGGVALDVGVGVAGFPEHGTTPGALIARARWLRWPPCAAAAPIWSACHRRRPRR